MNRNNENTRTFSNGMALVICVKCLDAYGGYPRFHNDTKKYIALDDQQAVTIKDGQALCVEHYEETLR